MELQGRKCHMIGTQPQSQQARGEALLDDETNMVSVRVRNLPGPSYFGRDLTTGEVLNLFEVWLDEPQQGHRICLGSMRRDGVYWIFEEEAELGVHLFNDVIITAEHDSCPVVSSGVVVMIGCCCSSK